MRLLLILLALATFAAPCRATNCKFTGGFAIRSPGGCADNTIDCGGGVVPRCCPAGFYCLTTDNAYCCPIEDDCLSDILNVPKCPHREWTLWTQENALIEDAWCCDDNWFGVVRMQGRAVACSPLASAISPRETPAIRLKNPESTCTTRSSSTTSSLISTTFTHKFETAVGPPETPTDTISPETIDATAQETTNTAHPETSVTTHPGIPSGSLDPVVEKDSDVSLNIGTVAGIVVGSIAGGAAIVVMAFWILKHRQRQGDATQNPGCRVQESQYCPEREAVSTSVPGLPAKEAHRVELEG